MTTKSERPISLSTSEVGTKTMQGASLMVLRTLLLYPIGFAGEVLLARLLSPTDFGIYAVASFVTVTLAGVLEVGLAASLIQRPEEPREDEYQTLFTVQLLGVTGLVLLTFLAAPLFFPLLHLDIGIRWTFLVMLLCPWVSTFGTISCVKLERQLRYAVFARIDVMRGLTYVTTAVILASLGARFWSFIAAITLSTVVKTWVAFRQAPWRLRFRLRLAGMGKTLRFGFIFQLSTLTSLFRDHIGVILGGPLFGVQSVGYLNWAKNTTYYSSQIFTQVVSRVAFPSISRVQDDQDAVRQMTQSLLKYINIFTFPVIAIFAALIPEVVSVFYTAKWMPAIPAFYFYSVRMLGSNVTTTYISVLNAVGKVNLSLRILVWWTLADWVLSLALCPHFGFTGIAMAYGLSVLPISIWLIKALSSVARIELQSSLYRPLFLSLAAAATTFWLKQQFHATWLSIVLLGGFGLSLFVVTLIVVEGKTLLTETRLFLGTVMQARSSK